MTAGKSNGRRKRIVTGIRPTGPLHLGHLYGNIRQMIELTEQHDCFYFSADYHVLTDKTQRIEIADIVEDNIIDLLACGLDPGSCTLFRQSDISQIPEFNLILSMVTPVGLLERCPLFREQVKELGIDNPSYGLLGYPVLQTADICMYRGEIVPVGEDQLPHLYIAADIAGTFRFRYGDIFPVPEPKIMEVFARIPGTDNRKMSKSYGNAINIADDEEATKKMVLTYYTDPKKPRKGDPGHPDECPVFYLHRLYLEGEPLDEIRKGCESGERMCFHCKEQLADEINEELRPIRAKREELKQDRDKLHNILADGAEKARAVAADVLSQCRKAIGIDRM